VSIKNKVFVGILFIVGFVFFANPAYSFDPLIFTKILGFQLEKNTLYDVQKALGAAPIVETGDAADYDASLYFITSDGSSVLVFGSGEMGGNTKDVLYFQVVKSDHYKKKKGQNFFKLSNSLGKDVIQGVYLGMSKKSFDDLFKGEIHSTEKFDSPEIKIKSKSTSLFFDGKEKIFDKEEKQTIDYDDAINIDAKFDEGGLYYLNVGRVEQN